MELQSDFRELLELFNKHDVEYLIVGGYALAFHGAPRYTGDIDILLHPTMDNSKRVMAALGEFGFGNVGLNESDFDHSGPVIQLGVPPVRVDLLTAIDGVPWEAACAGKAPGRYGDVPVNYIGRWEFIANKRAAGRQKDLADIEALGGE